MTFRIVGNDFFEFYKLHEDVILPSYGTERSACFDVHAYLKEGSSITINGFLETVYSGFISIPPYSPVLIPTGLIVKIPQEWNLRLHPRSGLSLKGLTLVNAEGVIDEDYVEELKIPIINLSKNAIVISNGMRICQAEPNPTYKLAEILETKTRPSKKTDRNGGFGSTGV